MSYTANWTDGSRLQAAVNAVRDDHFIELGDAVNRRKMLAYQGATNFAGSVVAQQLIHTVPLTTIRAALLNDVLLPPAGVLGGQPSSPTSMQWLWPVADGDENQVIVPAGAGTGQVNLLIKTLGSSTWTDGIVTSARTPIRAPHVNELRACLERVTRGRWRMPLYMSAGMLSTTPDTGWPGGYISNVGPAELRGLAFGCLRFPDAPQPGLGGVSVRASSSLAIYADIACQVQVYRCLQPVDYYNNLPSWNCYDPAGGRAWATPGGTGSGDAVFIGTVACPANGTGTLTGANLATALQAMVDGAEQSFLFRRYDVAAGTVYLEQDIIVEFDLDSPPN